MLTPTKAGWGSDSQQHSSSHTLGLCPPVPICSSAVPAQGRSQCRKDAPGLSAEQGPVLKASLSKAPCVAAGDDVSSCEPACPEALLAHTERRSSTGIWLMLCNGLMGCKRLHSISRHPDTSPSCCCGPQGV